MKPTWQTDDGSVQLYLGDCLEILPTLGNVDAVVTDPPYGMAYRSGWRQVQHGMISGDQDAALLSWCCDWSRRNARHSSYLFCRWDNIPDVSTPDSFVTWVKNDHSSGDLQHKHGRATEGIVFYRGPDHRWASGRPRDVVFADRVDAGRHPTEKPVSLMIQVVEWTIGTVVDPFMGSGTTGVACVQEGRRFIGIEKEPKYFEIAKRRIMDELNRTPLFDEPKAKQKTLLECS